MCGWNFSSFVIKSDHEHVLRILHTSSGIEIGEYGGGDEENERNSGSQNMVWRNKVIY